MTAVAKDVQLRSIIIGEQNIVLKAVFSPAEKSKPQKTHERVNFVNFQNDPDVPFLSAKRRFAAQPFGTASPRNATGIDR